MRQRWMAAGAAVAAVVLVIGCGASEPSGGDQGQAPSTSTTAAAGAGGCSSAGGPMDLEAILGLVPDTADTREYTVVADLRAFLDDQDKVLLDDFREIEFVDPVALFTPTELLQNALSQADETSDPLADEYGIGLGQIDQGVYAGMAPETTELLIGTFDPAAVDEAVAADPFWSDQKENVEAHGETYFAWGDDNEVQMEGRSPIRELGIGGRLWVDQGVAAFTRATAPMESFLAGCAGAEPTLAADADLAGIAQRLDAYEGAFRATFTDQVREPGDIVTADRSTGSAVDADESVPLAGVTAYGFAGGPSDDPEEARILLVLATGSDAEAADNVERFAERVETGTSSMTRRPWSDLVRIETIEADGSFLVVDLRANNSMVLENDLQGRDSLIVSEG